MLEFVAASPGNLDGFYSLGQRCSGSRTQVGKALKLLGVFSVNPPAPRMYYAPWITWIGVMIIGVLWSWAYSIIGNSGKRHWWDRGVIFGLVGWMLMVPWLELYVHWNILLEPAALVGLDAVCWAAGLMVVGLTIAGFDHLLKRVGLGE